MPRVLLGSPFVFLFLLSCTGSEGAPAQPKQPQNTQGTKTASVAATKTATAALTPKPAESKIKYAKVEVRSSLEDALTEAEGKELGTLLSQISTRVLVWWIDVQKDFRKGDRLELVYEVGDPEPIIHALWFQSEKMGRTFSAVRYQPNNASFARYYDERGEEVELRLVDSPLENYEQVTSLLNDGRRHKGVDFKTPVESAVKAPFDGVVLKKNWGRANGNCLWLADSHGLEAKMLHLDHFEAGIGAGSRFSKGQVIARSGNTGRSFAPHLHYQLERGGRVVDPFKVHKTYRAQLTGDEVEKAKALLMKHASLRMGAS